MNLVTITFDSNVFPKVVNPDKYPNEESVLSFKRINSSIRNGYAKGFLAETIFTLDAINKKNRLQFFKEFSPNFSSKESIQNNSRRLSISMNPDTTSHPGNNQYLESDLNDALQLGFKILPCTRIGWFRNPDLQREWFVQLTETNIHEYEDKVSEIIHKIDKNRCGSFYLKEIGEKYKRGTEHWTNALKNVPESEEKAMIKAFAEWADGDAIAFHIAYGNEYFCTRDQGRNAGQGSVMSKKNREWLEED
ncbi:hypothetical protein ACSQ6I_12725 [Anabaena sp. WFMT]|uniref:hypothetical protein n=1 Tax=Anabaena sp. WFMT TaxID=3449730 RepID=UPI003F268ABD